MLARAENSGGFRPNQREHVYLVRVRQKQSAGILTEGRTQGQSELKEQLEGRIQMELTTSVGTVHARTPPPIAW